jgi:hypothetical protein
VCCCLFPTAFCCLFITFKSYWHGFSPYAKPACYLVLFTVLIRRTTDDCNYIFCLSDDLYRDLSLSSIVLYVLVLSLYKSSLKQIMTGLYIFCLSDDLYRDLSLSSIALYVLVLLLESVYIVQYPVKSEL